MSQSKRKLIILDANVIIHAHELGIWNHLVYQYDVCIVGIVIDDEAKYFQSQTGIKTDIDLKKNELDGKIHRLDPDLSHTQKILKEYKEIFVKGLDPGERDAITLLNSGSFDEHLFCSGDKSAIKAAAVIDKTFNVISLEKLLRESGQAGCVKNLKHEFLESYTKQYINAGVMERAMHKKSV
ncbi:MAG: hypothetical protein JNL11_08995 [Bdellovibrionaceae bacterium]|nr:hypothetical protein [Pseudobdellovibrionaceae bacterium]